MKHLSTRILMSCAAIGAAGGVIFTANAWLGGTLSNLLPLAYGLTIGLYFIPGVVAQRLMQRPGVGFLTAAFSGLIASPFQPIFFGAFLISLVIGVLHELPFLIARYRVWKPWLFAVGSLGAGLITSGAAFQLLSNNTLGTAGIVLAFVCFGISPFLFTMLSLWLASALARAGVGRGLRRDRATIAPAPRDGDDIGVGVGVGTSRGGVGSSGVSIGRAGAHTEPTLATGESALGASGASGAMAEPIAGAEPQPHCTAAPGPE
ncbi:MAG: ECF transporter S component [Pseudoclavibacter sp.]